MVVYLTIADDSSTLRQLATQPMAENLRTCQLSPYIVTNVKSKENDLTETRRKFCHPFASV